MVNFTELFVKISELGVKDSLLPFMFVFVLVFGILEKAKILGDKSRRFNVVLSIIFGLLFVIPHVTHTYPPGYDPVEIANNAIPDMALAIVGVFCFWLLVAAISHKGAESILKPDVTKLVLLMSAVAVGFLFAGNAGWIDIGILGDVSKEHVANVALVLFFLFLIFYVVKGEEKEHHKHKEPIKM